jgi:hypothetical protein
MKSILVFTIALAGVSAHATQFVFSHGPIEIPTSGASNPSPIVFNAVGLDNVIQSVELSVNGISHTFPDDISGHLLNPAGAGVRLFSGPGAGDPAVNLTWLFTDSAAAPLPDTGTLTSGSFQPGQNQWNDLPIGGPAITYGSAFSVWNGTNGNGTWNMYISDHIAGDGGSVQSVDLIINTVPEPASMAALGIGLAALLRRRRK